MRIVDDLIAPELACECRQWLLSQTLVFGWKAHTEAPGVFWHRNFVLPGVHPHHYEAGAWNPAMTYEAFVASGSPLRVLIPMDGPADGALIARMF